MASSEQEPRTPEQTSPTSWLASPTPEQTASTSEQAPPTPEQAVPPSDTPRSLDFTYKLLVEKIDGGDPTQCSNPDDHIRLRPDTTSIFISNDHENQVLCRAYFDWSGYRGDVSAQYGRRDDMFCSYKSPWLNLQTLHGPHGTIVEMTMLSAHLGMRFAGGTLTDGADRYVRMYVKFATAVGSPPRSATVWGKRVIGNETLDLATLSGEERRLFGIDGYTWTRPLDD